MKDFHNFVYVTRHNKVEITTTYNIEAEEKLNTEYVEGYVGSF